MIDGIDTLSLVVGIINLKTRIMKKLLLVVVAMFAVANLNAQVYVGGTVGLTHSKVSDGDASAKGTSYKIVPEIGYRLSDKIAIGASLGYMKGAAALGSFDASDFTQLAKTIAGVGLNVASDFDNNLKSYRFAPYVRYTALSNKYI